MGRLKTAKEIAEKWTRVVQTRTEDYAKGVSDTDVDWAGKAAAGKDAYEQGVTEAISRDAFGAGVRKAGNDKWRRKTVDVGTQRWAPGVRAGQDDFEEGFGRFIPIIEKARAELPPRRPRGDPQNAERSAMMGRALAEARRRG